MKHFLLIVSLFIAVLSFGQMDHIPNELLVQFAPSARPEGVLKKYELVNGAETGIAIEKKLSEPMNLFKVTFSGIEDHQLLRILKGDKDITICQFNHYVYPRETTPDDPELDQQWHHINDGINGFSEDADIDSDLAWDVTTGGNTAMGDTIVVCVIEGGNLEHPDLIGNAWFNYNEIPDNGIDDDAIGYIDDFQGWNVNSEDDEDVYNGNHGTKVMGMIGAKGNNDLGVVGANWNVKIMSVTGENTSDEASIVEAYTYPLVQRKLYNETNGVSGAFVVATNASWGIDEGNPDDVPIWSAFYDTLGLHGILNCGATSNSPVNVDVVGDIPTSVESIYMISVTATNSNDVRTFSGYGQTTIDLGAPGSAVYSTSGNDEYSSSTGTSFASPLTAGVIALLYSVPCTAFIESVHANPQYGSDYIRSVLFQGVDLVDNLESETVTGGRLNANNSVQLMIAECGNVICFEPTSFNVSMENDTLYNFTWNVVDENFSVVRMYQNGSTDYSYFEYYGINEFSIDTLSYCTDYVFDIANNCEGLPYDELEYGSSISFETLGCCIAPIEVNTSFITETSVIISWESSLGIDNYNVYYRLEGEDDWIFVNQAPNNLSEITDLEPCNSYETNVIPACTTDLDAGTTAAFITLGCGTCLDLNYCDNYSESSNYEYIESVEIGTYLNDSGNNGGYVLFDDSELELTVGSSYLTTLTPGFAGGDYNEAFGLWIDLNQDGEFGDDELLMSSSTASSDPLIDEIEIPNDATLGGTRMRVKMKYRNNQNPGNHLACEIYDDGETEDYCINIIAETNGVNELYRNSDITIFPNPSADILTIALSGVNLGQAGVTTFRLFDVLGKQVVQQLVLSEKSTVMLNLPAGVYAYQIIDSRGRLMARGKQVIQ